VVGVISVPPSWNVDAKWTDFTNASIDWLRSLYSERLKSVVAHLDEHCLHIHYWLIPNNDESIGRVHPGEAELQRVGFGAPRIVRETAYKKAMTSMLDDFELRVTSKFGLLRRTVNKRRLSRQEWIRQKWLAAENKSLIKNSAIESEDKDKKISSANQLSYSDSGFSEPIVTVAPSAEMSGPEYPTEGLGIFGQWIIALRHDEEVRQVDRPVF
jgi:hypothetical protein